MPFNHPYQAFSRFTDPQAFAFMLDELPEDVMGICEVAKEQTIHHNLLPYFGLPTSQWKQMKRVWPPNMPDILRALQETAPHHLSKERQPAQRIIGACMLESHFLAGLLRAKSIPARIRAGYFKDIRAHGSQVVRFWEQLARAKGRDAALLEADPERWRAENNAYTTRQNALNHHIEHWVCEYWDARRHQWRLLDANETFLKAHSDLEVGFHLPNAHFEYASAAWQKMRSTEHFNPDQYCEEPQDGRSHIRSQLLWDFFSLLNHDLAGVDEPSGAGRKFIKEQSHEETSPHEVHELDLLATLLAQDPPVEELVAFYRRSPTLRIAGAEQDRYSAVSSQ